MKIWAAGDTSKTVREIVQAKLLGEPGQLGTGMIPGDLISKITHKSGVADAIDTVWVKHASGKTSHLVLKSYDQRRESFQGTEQDVIWLDGRDTVSRSGELPVPSNTVEAGTAE